ncbi:phosphonate degradation HD-domain oxygenase [Bordetella holmesii]|uniref:Phosphonate degradation operons associated HDIG domain protein n=2 Tax=Bordetella holmesii TaxID=35814 RepID=A0A158M0T3_9BORD|nr:phosphonate degradation HD-domain oxygenase [Bordetella holmesii]AIT27228.1 HD domain protein [Bordetella holmesii 44057]EWM41685.1 HD domain protein [Bordetella holmesii 41130]EWM47810.1 HD domain protein [Bordetella holmesii 35009]EWM51977.1 HD domain protein [Bordetella holmesii 70147]AMD46089.1 phosphohydrolase [Bordetella holmesii H558]
MPLSLYDIEQIFLERGHRSYDCEPVSHLKHALQTATLAEQAGASAHLVTACLLHDLGHLIADHPGTPTLRGVDDKHQYFVLPFLRGLFDTRVLDPICLHVEAKRYLCYVEADYACTLSEDSRRSLNLQGGSFDAAQAMDFASLPGAADAIRLRRWDDQAKSPTMITGSLAHFLQLAAGISERHKLLAA